MTTIDLALDGPVTAADVAAVAAAAPARLLLWSDAAIERETGKPARFPLAERRYLAERMKGVAAVGVTEEVTVDRPSVELPEPPVGIIGTRRRVLVTGCFDLFHAGHLRFFEEAREAGNGELHVVVGHDANIRLLKGEGRPLVDERQRRAICDAFTPVTQAHVSTGDGWLDAEPEVERLRPSVYVVNHDGDRPEKAEFCRARGIEYVVLARRPAPGLKARSSTDLRSETPGV